jgi:hypothetical protein
LLVLKKFVFFEDDFIFLLFKGHPNPCKHGGECVLDSKNSMKGSCTCKGHYFGPTCEEKDGCHSKYFIDKNILAS